MPTCRSLVVSGARASPRSMPPYLPILLVGVTTSGFGGRRCSTGGSLPCLTRSASMGASLNWVGLGVAGFSWSWDGGGAGVVVVWRWGGGAVGPGDGGGGRFGSGGAPLQLPGGPLVGLRAWLMV